MVAEVLELLGGLPLVLDCTLGGGGHSAALLASGSDFSDLDAYRALAERSRVGTTILLLAVATIAGLEVRIWDIWGGTA